nr:hypothetical protein [Deltaproteobacteria bacterium]
MAASKTTRAKKKVELTVDPELKEKWDALDAAMHKARIAEGGSFDTYWEHAATVIDHEPPLYLAGGYASAKAFVEEHLHEKERTARRWMRVARYASPNEISHHGPSKLDAALSLLEAGGNDLSSGKLPVDFGRVRVSVERDGKTSRVALDDASVDEIAAAVKAALRANKKAPGTHPMVKAVTKALAADKTLRGVTVRRVGQRTSLANIDDAAWPALKRALRGLKLPVG